MSNIINQLQHAVQEMDGLERAAFSIWALGSIIFWTSFVYILYLLGKDFFGRVFKKAN
jgi:hypothetical protein